MTIFAVNFSEQMLNKRIPDYYATKDNIIFYLIIVFFFSLLFVNIFTPFKGAWYNIHEFTRAKLFADTLIIISSGTLVLVVSRTILYRTHQRHPLTYLQYWSWHIVEVFIIAFLYAIIVRYAVQDTRDFSEIFGRAVVFVPAILVFPTVFTLLYLGTRDKDEKISELQAMQAESPATTTPEPHHTTATNDVAEEEISFSTDFAGEEFVLDNHLTATSSQPGDGPSVTPATKPEPQPETAPQSKIINFFDDKGELQLSLRIDHIYYIESAENYVHIFYKNKENVERFTLRSSLKKQQEKLEKYGFIRCHRCYLVNFANILLLRKDKDGPYLDFGESGLQPIPVSKTYLESVTAYFISNSEE